MVINFFSQLFRKISNAKRSSIGQSLALFKCITYGSPGASFFGDLVQPSGSAPLEFIRDSRFIGAKR